MSMWLEAILAGLLAVVIGGGLLFIGGEIWWQIEKRRTARGFDRYVTAWRSRNCLTRS